MIDPSDEFTLRRQLAETLKRVRQGESMQEISASRPLLETKADRLIWTMRIIKDAMLVRANKSIDQELADERARNITQVLEAEGLLR